MYKCLFLQLLPIVIYTFHVYRKNKTKLKKLHDYCNLALKLNIIMFDTECNRFVFFYIEQDWMSV